MQLAAQDSKDWDQGNYYGTSDPILACVLGTLGFVMRGNQPISLYYNGNLLMSIVDAEDGDVGELANVSIVFENACKHERLGLIQCSMVARALKFCRLSRKREKGDMSMTLTAQLEEISARMRNVGTSAMLVDTVQNLLDFQANWHVLCETLRQLQQDPFICFSNRMSSKKMGHVINPLNVDKGVIKRSETFLKK